MPSATTSEINFDIYHTVSTMLLGAASISILYYLLFGKICPIRIFCLMNRDLPPFPRTCTPSP